MVKLELCQKFLFTQNHPFSMKILLFFLPNLPFLLKSPKSTLSSNGNKQMLAKVTFLFVNQPQHYPFPMENHFFTVQTFLFYAKMEIGGTLQFDNFIQFKKFLRS